MQQSRTSVLGLVFLFLVSLAGCVADSTKSASDSPASSPLASAQEEPAPPAAPSPASEVISGFEWDETGGSDAVPPVIEGESALPPEAGQVQGRGVAPSVVIYEHPNFGGQSLTLGVGGHILSDFNEIASSIQVPPGLVALLYEHVDAGGGYGRSVDLLEDRPDLSQVYLNLANLNDKVSYVCVFSSPTPEGYIWARASLQNGQFVAGHWERRPASGTPVNTTAVLSPPYPPHLPGAPPASCEGGSMSTEVRDHRGPLPPAAPSGLNGQAWNPNELYLAWRDNSSDEIRFDVWFGKQGGVMKRYIVEANKYGTNVYKLQASTTYCFTIQAVGMESVVDSGGGIVSSMESKSKALEPVCAKTLPAPAISGKTVDLILSQTIFNTRFRTFSNQYPESPSDANPNGKLITITNNMDQSSGVFIAFLKKGYNTDLCDRSDAVVTLQPGKSTTPQTMQQIYGTSTPSFTPSAPVVFLACAGSPTGTPQYLRIRITFTVP